MRSIINALLNYSHSKYVNCDAEVLTTPALLVIIIVSDNDTLSESLHGNCMIV